MVTDLKLCVRKHLIAKSKTTPHDPYQQNLDFGFDPSVESVEDSFERNGSNWVTPPSVGSEHQDPDHVTRRMERLGQSLEPTLLALPNIMLYTGFRTLAREMGGDFHSIFPNTLREPQKPTTERVLSDYGDNFASVLQHVTRNSRRKEEIVNVLSRVVEGVCDMRVRAVGSYLVAELQHQDLIPDSTPNESAPWFDLAQESDGTLRMLGLLTALYQASGPRSTGRELLAIEEPEIALHPGALTVLADELKAASRRRQLLVTTQSPDLIARFPAANLRVVERIAGVTHIAPLDETQRRVIEDQLFDAGELLRSEGLRGAAR